MKRYTFDRTYDEEGCPLRREDPIGEYVEWDDAKSYVQWQPIETAQKSVTVLGLDANTGYVYSTRYSISRKCWLRDYESNNGLCELDEWSPTHWIEWPEED
jgi:hypothetical protein